MRSLALPDPPFCLTDLAADRPNGPWFGTAIDAEITCRRTTREVLLNNQDVNCGWCEAKITLKSSHAEHIKPKSAYASLTFAISNLIACCGKTHSPTCGHHKNDRVLAAWVHPYDTDRLQDCFNYEIDGKMTPKSIPPAATNEEALDAIDTILNLNESVLRSKRESLIADILNSENYQGFSPDEIFTITGEFRSVIEQYAS